MNVMYGRLLLICATKKKVYHVDVYVCIHVSFEKKIGWFTGKHIFKM